jgi:nucleoside-diphosphate-sugar epimerase
MRILVTGATGFLGTHVVARLLTQPGATVTALVRPGNSRDRVRLAGHDGPQGVVADLLSPEDVRRAVRSVRPEVLVHLAALVHHAHDGSGGAAMHALNFHAAVGLHEQFLAAGGRRFVFAGSCFEYGHHDAERLDEDAPCRPRFDYAVSKVRATTALLDRAASTGTEVVALRVFMPYGPGEASGRLVPQLLRAGLTGGALRLTPGEQVRDWVYAGDVAGAFTAAAAVPRLARPQVIYNVCSGVGHSLRQVAAAAEDVVGRPLAAHWGALPYRPDELMRLVGCNRRVRDELGWQAGVDLRDGLRRTADAWRLEDRRAA